MELLAPPRWSCVDFISDLHLQASDTKTFQTLSHYLNHTIADAVFILGDLFEVWVGDDALVLEGSFERRCVDLLHTAGLKLDLHIMQGNRDFLMGTSLMKACHATLLEDPSVLVFASQRWLLTHGDAWCLEDTQYMQFRAQVRHPDWQTQFLQKPLAERVELARGMRTQSEARKRTAANYADVDAATANALLVSAQAHHMVHGHTHRPARHSMLADRERLVLSDWDLMAVPPRAEVLRLRQSGQTPGNSCSYTVERLPPTMATGVRPTRPKPAD